MPDSDSEDDFMSDKFLNPTASSSSSTTHNNNTTYADRRKAALLKQRQSQQKPLKQREEEARRKGLGRSLFAGLEKEGSGAAGERGGSGNVDSSKVGGKALGMMMKMGWKPGEALGKVQIDSPTSISDQSRETGALERLTSKEEEPDEYPSPAGIGIGFSRKRQRSTSPLQSTTSTTDLSAAPPPNSKPRIAAEPIRISMWSGKAGLGLRPRSPSPPLDTSNPNSTSNQTDLDPTRLAELTKSTETFRARQSLQMEEKKIEGREWAARKILMELDQASEGKDGGEEGGDEVGRVGVAKFHPLYVMPGNPIQTIPGPLLRIIFPHLAPTPKAKAGSTKLNGSNNRSSVAYDSEDHLSEEEDEHKETILPDSALDNNKSVAQKMRAQMKRDALASSASSMQQDEDEDEDNDQDERDVFANGIRNSEFRAMQDQREDGDQEMDKQMEEADIDWASLVDGVKKVLAMSVSLFFFFSFSSLQSIFYPL